MLFPGTDLETCGPNGETCTAWVVKNLRAAFTDVDGVAFLDAGDRVVVVVNAGYSDGYVSSYRVAWGVGSAQYQPVEDVVRKILVHLKTI